jgi:hypothetical protein
MARHETSFSFTDSCGRRVSLLNDQDREPIPPQPRRPSCAAAPHYSPPNPQAPRVSSTPATPELFRSNSYDSQMNTEPVSPLTPLYEPVYGYYGPKAPGLRSPYAVEYHPEFPPTYAGSKRRPSAHSDGRSVTYEDDYEFPTVTTPATAAGIPTSERPGKRFPCRYRDTHGCEKTFTTSGHASRHSKIHTAEKAVPCSFEGCTKKFTRADNMKQHLETHFKDKPRSHGARPSISTSERRSFSKSFGRSSRAANSVVVASPPAPLPARRTPMHLPSRPALARSTTAGVIPESLPSPIGNAWDMGGLHIHLHSRPSVGRAASGGLETLAMAASAYEAADADKPSR